MSTEAPPFEVKRWQTYLPCSPLNWQRSKPFVVEAVDGDRVKVWDPTGGQRMGGHRWISIRHLHASGTFKNGKRRRMGWYLHCEPPADPARQELCGACFTWLDREEFDRLAWGFGHSTCRPCKSGIDERYGFGGGA